ncbi:MarR family winged helix-turn-helix transcriptional regulator [Lentzea sp.]|uniref:MarR family winged helix-turn-helix transcriptional regulator n=1 Tax=Lentzea sp. TaxID=56099 RepID=UPI002ED388F1
MTGIDGTDGLDRRLVDAFVRLGYGMRSSARRTAREHGLSRLQQHVLLALDRPPQARHEVAALAAEFGVATSTLSASGTALKRKGLVTRSPDKDGRRRVLALTEAGKEVARALSTQDDPLMAALAGIREQDRVTTLRTVLRMITDLESAGVVGATRTCPSPSGEGSPGLQPRFDEDRHDTDDGRRRL